jgi:hypothetical protein
MFMLLDGRAREEVARADIDAVEATGRRIVDVCERGSLPWRSIGHSFIGMAAHLRGDPERAEEELRRAIAVEPPGAFSGQALSLLVRHLAHTGRGEEVVNLFETHRSTFPEPGAVVTYGTWNCMLGLVEALYLSGHRSAAATLSPSIGHVLAAGPEWSSFDCRLLRTRAGIAAAAEGRWAEAEEHFTRAEEQAGRASNTLELVDLRRLRAQVLVDRRGPGDEARADELLSLALAEYRRLGMAGYAAQVERTRAGLRR